MRKKYIGARLRNYSSPALFLCIFLLQACKFGSNYKAPAVDLPASFLSPISSETTSKPLKEWWTEFNDLTLNSFITEALSANADLMTAMNNISKAQAELSLGQSYLLPHIDLQATATKTKSSKNLPAQGRSPLTKNTSISGIATYEIDLWGKVARANEAARAMILSAQSNVEAVKLAMVSSIINGYFNMLALDEKIIITKQLISIEQELLAIVAAQARHGAADDIALSSATSALALSEASLPPLQQQLQEQETALAILLGKSPKTLIETRLKRSGSLGALPPPPSPPGILPSELLTRRPDIKAAEENLKAANAMIGVAKAAYFPSLSLSALIGLSSTNIDQLFNRHSRTYELAKNVSLPIFDFGARHANVNLAKIVVDQALIQYALTVRTAFGDVANALAAINSSGESCRAVEKNEKAAVVARRLTEQLYKHGKAGHSTVLSAKKNELQAKLNSIDTRLVRLQASAGLFQAMGGGL